MKRLGFVHKNGPIEIHQIPALKDNYFYIFRNPANDFTAAIDPGEAAPIIEYCEQNQWHLDRILVTHHHWDHTDGNQEVSAHFQCPIYALKDDAHRVPGATHFFEKAQATELAGQELKILFTPAHTLGHICLHFPQLKILFCGDTLFSFGCGRLFEGTPEMMLSAFRSLRALPLDTLYFCGHEYTQTNLDFALSLEPHSQELKTLRTEVLKRRTQSLPTVPALLQQEVNFSPFMRWDDPILKKALHMEFASDIEVFTHLRQLRNQWQ